jgi:hypothetical protein
MAGENDNDGRIDFPDYPPLDESGTVDLWQLESNLALTPAQRMRQLDGFLELCQAMKRAGKKHYDQLSSVDPKTA